MQTETQACTAFQRTIEKIIDLAQFYVFAKILVGREFQPMLFDQKQAKKILWVLKSV